MSYWNLYFLVKVGLYFTGYIGFSWWLNLLLWLALQPPIGHRLLRRTRAVLAWPAAIALLYYDSYLPTLGRVLSQLKALAGFSADYWMELAGRLVNPTAVAIAVAGVFLYAALARRVRFATFALIGILSVPLVAALQERGAQINDAVNAQVNAGDGSSVAGADAADPDALLQKFYASESQKRMQFSTAGGQPPFDIILLHVCSLSWDDMEFVGQRNHPLLQRFDVLFTNFNSAASYSGPASLRVLHGSCGQTPHNKLYEGIDIGGETVGLITYMRTDGVQMAPEAIDAARSAVADQFGPRYVPEKARIYSTKAKNAQEAHEAIRPTDFNRSPDKVRRFLDGVTTVDGRSGTDSVLAVLQ